MRQVYCVSINNANQKLTADSHEKQKTMKFPDNPHHQKQQYVLTDMEKILLEWLNRK